MPEVTTVITTTGSGRGLGRAVHSVRAQTVESALVVVVDGVAEDEQDREVLSALRSSDRVVDLTRMGRPGPARSAGLALVSTRLVGFLDDDDEYLPHKTERQMDVLRDHDAVLVCSDAWKVDIDSKPQPYGVGPSRAVTVAELRSTNPVITSTTLADADALRSVGGFAGDEDLRFCDDYIAWLRLACVGDVRLVDEPLVNYAVGSPGSLSAEDPRSGAETVVLAAEHAFSGRWATLNRKDRPLSRLGLGRKGGRATR